MEINKKDKLLLLLEETSNLVQESNQASTEKIKKLDSTIDNKLNLVNSIIKGHNLDIRKFQAWINSINKNEEEIKKYTSQFEEISNKLNNNIILNQFEYGLQNNYMKYLQDDNLFNILKTIQIREKKQKKELDEISSSPMNSLIIAEKIKNIVKFFENISGIRIEKDKNENDTLIIHAFEGFNLLNDLKSCDFSLKYKNGKFYIVKMNPIFNPKPYEDEINGETPGRKNLGAMIGNIILNEFPQYVIT